MKVYVLTIAFFVCSIQMFYSQEDDGVVSLVLPIRNSLTFNQYAINPTFSFVRQQHKYISITNKREWVQFEDAPQTYLVSFSGRFRENMGLGVGVFQQNYGVLTTFGGILNVAYNARLQTDSNLTFGLNVGAYKSGLNEGSVITNFPDPSLDNIPSNFMLTVNPGINYGTAFLDLGVSLNNLVLYNFNSSKLIEDNPEQSIQAHLMYTGYVDSRGFFDESKFSGLIKSEFKKDKTVVSGIAMLTVPKGIWAQVGYNNLYGASGGLGLNITNQIAIEYNFEKALGDLTDFGPSHEITLAYRFKNNQNYDYSNQDEISALITTDKKRKPVSKISKLEADANRKLSNEAKASAEIEAKEKAAQAKEAEEARLKVEAENKAKAEAQAKLDAENKAKAEEEAKQIAKEVAEAKAKIAAENKAKAEAAKLAEAKLKAEETAAKAKLAAENKARLDAEAKVLAENKAKEEAAAKLKEAEESRLAAEAKAREEKEAKERAIAQAKADSITKVKAEAVKEAALKPTDAIAISMNSIEELTKDSKIEQAKLLTRLNEVVASKNKDLKDLKEENDLSEKGIYMEPKPFKSLTAENNELEALKENLDVVIKARSEKIKELEDLYERRVRIATLENDEVNLYYKNTIKRLKAEQLTALETKTALTATLEDIKVATEYERKRRIKRAAYDNEEDKYFQDRAALNVIKQNTRLSSEPLRAEDFDSGEEQSDNIQILKNVKNVENGYYLIIAVHNDVDKRDDFLRKAVASGRNDIDFFYDVNTSKYYIYYQKFDSIEAANEALKSKGSKPYNGKLSVVKIEN
ncbi:MAG: PorP/SprF family type IX secretion system membrane protein [Gelidibacter sp.]|nr:PorP/SprF family type IX secretion system membrane protein [Gelidibacter sp.]